MHDTVTSLDSEKVCAGTRYGASTGYYVSMTAFTQFTFHKQVGSSVIFKFFIYADIFLVGMCTHTDLKLPATVTVCSQFSLRMERQVAMIRAPCSYHE